MNQSNTFNFNEEFSNEVLENFKSILNRLPLSESDAKRTYYFKVLQAVKLNKKVKTASDILHDQFINDKLPRTIDILTEVLKGKNIPNFEIKEYDTLEKYEYPSEKKCKITDSFTLSRTVIKYKQVTKTTQVQTGYKISFDTSTETGRLYGGEAKPTYVDKSYTENEPYEVTEKWTFEYIIECICFDDENDVEFNKQVQNLKAIPSYDLFNETTKFKELGKEKYTSFVKERKKFMNKSDVIQYLSYFFFALLAVGTGVLNFLASFGPMFNSETLNFSSPLMITCYITNFITLILYFVLHAKIEESSLILRLAPLCMPVSLIILMLMGVLGPLMNDAGFIIVIIGLLILLLTFVTFGLNAISSLVLAVFAIYSIIKLPLELSGNKWFYNKLIEDIPNYEQSLQSGAYDTIIKQKELIYNLIGTL